MAGIEDRREPRIHVALPVTLQMPDGELEYQTKDASYKGVFIVCPNPLPLKKLVRFTTRLPDESEPLQMLGLVSRTVNAADAQERSEPAGMGIQLYSVGKQTREAWQEYVRAEYEKNPEAAEHVRLSELPHVRVHMRSMEQLSGFVDNDLPAGGIFVRTNELHPEGSEIVCDIIHPETSRAFSLAASVAEVTTGSRRERGMRIAFDALEPDQEMRLGEFIRGEEGLEELSSQIDPE